MKMWHVKLMEIEWDGGKGEYDTSHLPKTIEIIVLSDTKDDAIQDAMRWASDTYGSLIEGCVMVMSGVG